MVPKTPIYPYFYTPQQVLIIIYLRKIRGMLGFCFFSSTSRQQFLFLSGLEHLLHALSMYARYIICAPTSNQLKPQPFFFVRLQRKPNSIPSSFCAQKGDTSHTSSIPTSRSASARQRRCIPDLHALDHVAGWETYSLHHLARVSCSGSVLYRSCTTTRSGRLRSR